MWLVCDYLPKAFLANLTALTLGPVVLYHAEERRGCEVDDWEGVGELNCP